MLSEVMWNISTAPEEVLPDKAAAIKAAVDDFQTNVTAKALVTLAQLEQIISGGIEMGNEVVTTPVVAAAPAPAPVPTASPAVAVPKHALDDTFAKIKASYDATLASPGLTRQQRLQQLQIPVNELGAVMLRGVDSANPLTTADIQKTVEETIQRAFATYAQGGGTLMGQPQMAVVPQNDGDPTPRQLMPVAPMGQAPIAQRSKLRDIVRRSVVGPGVPPAPQAQ
jgi:hypothetical protein